MAVVAVTALLGLFYTCCCCCCYFCCHNCIQAASEEEREHAELLMEYQNVRGGRVRLASMLQPEAEFNHDEKVGGRQQNEGCAACLLPPCPRSVSAQLSAPCSWTTFLIQCALWDRHNVALLPSICQG